eukprot:TRINITY_DN58190_c0_g1_i1.p1 TRINITY_DN58190_c0_g1~~TRINITY_DN58190_c0_g1_i1.p1  ORF type:complete len:579 (+),score=66.05 TRINITY_DN58190_c0_g1_i1:58-1794(+)
MGMALCRIADTGILARAITRPSELVAPDARIATSHPSEQPWLRRQESSFVFDRCFSRECPGKLEDFYEVEEELGQGAFGRVNRAKCLSTGEVRALKSVYHANESARQAFETEISIQRRLDHPNVLRIFETFRDAQQIYVVMELCTGGELFSHVLEGSPRGFSEHRAALYIQQMLACLRYIHAQKIVHRDLKPENLLLRTKSSDAVLKLIDFGLAAELDLAGPPLTLYCGSPYYVAPEVLKCHRRYVAVYPNHQGYDEKCDVWSIGVISFLLLCGEPPFQKGGDEAQSAKIIAGKYSFEEDCWKLISNEAKNIIDLLLTLNPQLRPSAAELLTHPWLTQSVSNQASIGRDFLKRLQAFSANSRLRRIALTAVAQNLHDDQIRELQDTFRAVDTDGDGLISQVEIENALRKQGVGVPADLRAIFKVVDTNASGSLDYTEFVAAALEEKKLITRDVCWSAFRVFDLDGDGFITREELAKVVSERRVQRSLGMDADRISRVIADVDTNGDGCVDFDEFCAMMMPAANLAKRGEAERDCEDFAYSPQKRARTENAPPQGFGYQKHSHEEMTNGIDSVVVRGLT